MDEKKKELFKKIATEFPTLKEGEKSYIAGYIFGVEEARARKEEAQTA